MLKSIQAQKHRAVNSELALPERSAIFAHGKYARMVKYQIQPERRVMSVSTYELLMILFTAGLFLIALLVYVDRKGK